MNISNNVDVPVHLSLGNMKLGRVWNISLIPVKDCGDNSIYCMNKCYAQKAYRMYPQTRRASGNNSNSFRNEPEIAFDVLNKWFKEIKPRYFRIHVSGDMINQEYLNSWIQICKNHPHTKYNCMTKRFDLDYSNTPKNMSVRFSMWTGMDARIDNPPEYGIQRVWLDDGIENRIPEGTFKCHGGCTDCMYCWNHKGDIVIKMH